MRVRLIFYGGSASVASLVGLQCTGSQPGPRPTLSASSSSSSQTVTITISKQQHHHCHYHSHHHHYHHGLQRTAGSLPGWRPHKQHHAGLNKPRIYHSTNLSSKELNLTRNQSHFLLPSPISIPFQTVACIRPCCVIYYNRLPPPHTIWKWFIAFD